MREGLLHPSLYQLNTRVRLTELSRSLGRRASLDDIPDAELDQLADDGFSWVWLLSVWLTGAAGQRISRANADWRREFEETLPDLREEDIAGSGFAVRGYSAHPALGGDAALARLRRRLRARGLRLMLDFVPNHTALDHPWASEHPEYYVSGNELDLAREPGNYTWVGEGEARRLLAHGRDPYFPGWPDTLQLDYANPATQAAMIGQLEEIAARCDGVRCDMAMLVLPDVFERTWGRKAPPFWAEAIRQIRTRVPEFRFVAEVYWDREPTMLRLGFDYAYDKRLYDRLRAGLPRPVHDHLLAGPDYQSRLVHFLENHDEPRAATTFPPGIYEAAAVVSYLSPGLRFFHQGQFEGRRKRISPHLVRAPEEPVDESIQRFYAELLAVLRRPVCRSGQWRLLECAPAWDDNGSWECFLCASWQAPEERPLLVTVNYAGHPSQCFVRLDLPDLAGRKVHLTDLMGPERYEREGDELLARGLYLDVAPWARHVFEIDTP